MNAGEQVAVRDPSTHRWTAAWILSLDVDCAVVVLRSSYWGVFSLESMRRVRVVPA